jgi:DNA-binding NarL/FixJ family response regulator
MRDVTEAQNYAFSQFIASRSVVIVDPNLSSRAGLSKTLVELGARASHVGLASNVTDGHAEIDRRKPNIVICEYDLGKSCGLELLQTLRANNPQSKDWIFLLLTANTSQSAVARAAEEDVDGFVLKPYTIGVLRQTIMKVALAKIQPSDYVKAIEAGKKHLEERNMEEAMKQFDQALALDPKPALAHFYKGQVELMQQAVKEAEGDYQAGLEHNKIHYKCLVGMFDLFMEQKRYAEAYDVVKKISRYFPANPQRMATVLRLAIMNQGFEDIERYYQMFCSLEQRNEELVKYVCAALVVCGKYYLQTNFPSRAHELFQKAAITAAGKTRILREIIQNLCDFDLANMAGEYLKRFPTETQSQNDFLAMQYLVQSKSAPLGVVIEQGRALIKKGHQDPLIYKILIRKSREAKFNDAAENLVQEAVKTWPERQAEFEKLLAEQVAQSTQ